MSDERTRSPSQELAGTEMSGAAGPDPDVPERIGPYEVVQRIGKGGMGVVYECLDPRLDRRVAIKLLRPGRDGDRARARMVREAQALAKISHPNVIAVFDVGTFDDEVFIAMELVEGPTLRRWLAKDNPAPATVIPAFVEIAKGLAAAHRSKITHRDFKPDNVIMGNDGRPRVLDFGIALSAEDTDGSDALTDDPSVIEPDSLQNRLTADGLVLGTLAYMAPEQARHSAADARSDQFSFCVALYEALYGRRPFSGASLELRLASIDNTAVQLPPDPDLPRHVRAVLRRGLRAEPDRRYASMEALLRELDPPHRGYRWAAGLGGLGVLLAAGISLRGPQESTAAADPCAEVTGPLDAVWHPERDQQLREVFGRADRIGGEVEWTRTRAAVDAHAEAWRQEAQALCDDERGSDLLPSRRQCLQQRHREFAAMLTLLEDADDDRVRGASRVVASLISPHECGQEQREATSAEAPETAKVRDELARIEGLLAFGQYGDAAAQIPDVLAAADALADPAPRAEARLVAAQTLTRTAKQSEVVPLLEEAVYLAQEAGADRTAARAACVLIYVAGYLDSDYEGAERWAELARATIERLGGDPLLEAERLNSLGAVYSSQGRFEDSSAAYERVLELVRSRLPPGHPKLIGTTMNWGTIKRRAGDLAGGRALLEQALAMAEETYGNDHPQLVEILVNLGSLEIAGGEERAAIDMLRRAIEIHDQRQLPPNHALATALAGLATALTRVGEVDEGLRYVRRAAEVGRNVLGAESVGYAVLLSQLGEALRKAGRPEEGVPLLREGTEVKRYVLGEDNEAVATSLQPLANAYAGVGDLAEARRHMLEARRILELTVPPGHARHGGLAVDMANLESKSGNHEAAIAEAERALEILDALPGQAESAALARRALAYALDAAGREPARAIQLATEALAVLKTHRPESAEALAAWIEERG